MTRKFKHPHLVRRKPKPGVLPPARPRKCRNPHFEPRRPKPASSMPEPVLPTSPLEPVSPPALGSSNLPDNMAEPMELPKTPQEEPDVPATKKAFVPLGGSLGSCLESS